MDTQLYPGIPFSPPAALTDNVGAGDTIIPVSDVEAFPPAPNLATIGADEEGETILYAAKTATALSGCTRGVEGTARAWSSGEPIARNWTAKDHVDLIAAVGEAAEAAQNAQTEAQEAKVGSDPAGTAATVVGTHNSDSTAHEDIRTAAQDALAEHQADSTAHGELFAAKQDKLTGAPSQVVGFNAQGAAQAVQGWSNPNLLDNWYFADPVNQRGKTEYTGIGYTIDRWVLPYNANAAIVALTPSGITISALECYLLHRMEIDVSGKQVTGSVLYADGTFYSGTAIFPMKNGEDQFMADNNDILLYLQYREASGNYPSFAFTARNTTKAIAAVKLEFGPVQTLAHQDTDGNWVLNDPPPNKALELAKCQRYYIGLSRWEMFPVLDVQLDYIDFCIPVPAKMRVPPAPSNLVSSWLDDTWNLTCVVNGSTVVRIRAAKQGHGLSAPLNPIEANDYAGLSSDL